MRDKILPFVLALAASGLVVYAAVRPKRAHEAPLVVIQEEGKPDASVDAGADASSSDASSDATSADASDAAPTVAASPKLLDRPLRVTTLGIALAAPGTMALESSDAGVKPGFDLELTPVESPQKLESRLVRGGADADGADVAILSLPDLVASSERLRALEPQAFLLVGFSQSTERLSALPGSPRVPAQGADIKVWVPTGDHYASRQWTALYALELAAVPGSRVKFLTGEEKPKDAAYLASTFLEKNDGEHLLSTVEAPALVPFVAVATKGSLTTKESLMRAFASAWVAGMQRAQVDPAAAAKRLVGKEGAVFSAASEVPSDVTVVVDRLGRVSKVGLGDNARYFGTAQDVKEGVTPKLGALANAMVESFTDAGLVATAPAWPLVERSVVAPLLVGVERTTEKLECKRTRRTPVASQREGATVDDATLQRHVEVAAVAFDGCVVRVSSKGGEKTATTFVEAARSKLGLSSEKLVVGKSPTQGGAALVEIVPPAP